MACSRPTSTQAPSSFGMSHFRAHFSRVDASQKSQDSNVDAYYNSLAKKDKIRFSDTAICGDLEFIYWKRGKP